MQTLVKEEHKSKGAASENMKNNCLQIPSNHPHNPSGMLRKESWEERRRVFGGDLAVDLWPNDAGERGTNKRANDGSIETRWGWSRNLSSLLVQGTRRLLVYASRVCDCVYSHLKPENAFELRSSKCKQSFWRRQVATPIGGTLLGYSRAHKTFIYSIYYIQ